MDDKEVTHGLSLLADEANPAPVDVDAVISSAKARARQRKASVATAFATLAVIGAVAATLGTAGGTSPTVGSEQPTTTAPQGDLPPEAVIDERSAEFTDRLAAAWPRIAPPGVRVSSAPVSGTAEPNRWWAEPLVFFGLPGPPGDVTYEAIASLVDDQGHSKVEIALHYGDEISTAAFEPCAPGSGCTYYLLPDGTKANVTVLDWTTASRTPQNRLEVLRPDGLRYFVWEHNPFSGPDSRPTPMFSVEDLLKFATLFSY